MAARYTHRIRRCDGNKAAWCLIRLSKDGTESSSYGSFTTAMSLDTLLKYAGHLKPGPLDRVEFIYADAP